jgi:hypothetical protein
MKIARPSPDHYRVRALTRDRGALTLALMNESRHEEYSIISIHNLQSIVSSLQRNQKEI